MGMTPHERVLVALRHKEADRVPIQDSPWSSTIDRWRTEGLPSGITPADFFGYELAGFSADTSPQFPIEVMREDEEYIVERDSFSGIRRNHRNRSTTPEIIDYPCKNRADWEKIKTGSSRAILELIGYRRLMDTITREAGVGS